MNESKEGLKRGEDGLIRCGWCGDDEDYIRYHDHEWGREQRGDDEIFERLSLEVFQAGLSWLTVLRKREQFRKAFAGFKISRVALFDDRDLQRLASDPGIIRHRGKIRSTIRNAQRALDLIHEFGSLHLYLKDFRPQKRQSPLTFEAARLLSQSEQSQRLSHDLKKRGFLFVGPTTCYSLMQAIGLVDDHLQGCFRSSFSGH